ncbi:MAG TPA: hypothetical protein VMA73_15720 [Streptosporangiaceae bacterium]|nr:hypothetical protein [Streptosporangiaceae bacterium]
MDLFTGLLMIAASHGASALVQALGGGTQWSSLAGDLVKALDDSESRIIEHLTEIELKLDELLEQRYNVAVGAGLRYLLDAIPARSPSRAHDLGHARDQFIEAQSAARSSLQQAVAERYLVLCSLGLKRTEAAMSALTRVEGLAMTAALEGAAIVGVAGTPQAAALMQREGFSLRHLADRDRRSRVESQVWNAADDTISISRQLLSEAAMLAPVVGLPPRAAPLRSKLMRVYDPAFWTFSMRTNETLRIGPLTVQIRPGSTSKARLDLAWAALLPLRVITRNTSPIPSFAQGSDNPPSAAEIDQWTPVQERAQWRDRSPCEVSISLPKPGHWPPTLTISRTGGWALVRINLHDPKAQIPPVLSFQAR